MTYAKEVRGTGVRGLALRKVFEVTPSKRHVFIEF